MRRFMSQTFRLRHAPPDGLIAATLLSFLASAGLFYVNVMPALIEGMTSELHFSARMAGLIGSVNVYGAAVGALLAAVLVTRIAWRPMAIGLLITLMAIDLISSTLTTAPALLAARALHGVTGGLLVGYGFAVIARTARPERAFGMLLVVQFGLGGLGVMFLPKLAAAHGAGVLFLALFAFSAVALAMLPWLAPYPPRLDASTKGAHARPSMSSRHSGSFALALLGVFLFQAANMALFSFIIGLARHFGLDTGFAASAVGASTWVGTLGSVLVVALSTRFGRGIPLLVSLALTVAGFWALHFSSSREMFVLANCGTAITWAFALPYLFGLCAEFDREGRAAALAGFASKLGLATGPLAGALLGERENYSLLIDLSLLGVVACAIATWIPVRLLDRRVLSPP